MLNNKLSEKLNSLHPLMGILYQDTYDSFSVFDNDYKYFSYMLAYCKSNHQSFLQLINSYAFYISDNGEKKIIKSYLLAMKKIVAKRELIETDIVKFNEFRVNIYKLLGLLEKSLKNSLILFSEMIEALPQKNKYSFVHCRKSSDDEMEILRNIKKRYIQTSLVFFEKWFNFENSSKYENYTVNQVFDELFRSTTIYIDYSTETKYQRNEINENLESILLPYSSILIPKNLSTISHECNYYILQTLRDYFNPNIAHSLNFMYESIDTLISRLEIPKPMQGILKINRTELIIEKMLTDYITLFTAGPNYLMSLFCLLSKDFLEASIPYKNAPNFARILFLTNIARDFIKSDSKKSNDNNLIEILNQVEFYTRLTLSNTQSINQDVRQGVVDFHNIICKKMTSMVLSEFPPPDPQKYHKSNVLNQGSMIPYPWKSRNRLFNSTMDSTKLIPKIIQLDPDIVRNLPSNLYQFTLFSTDKESTVIGDYYNHRKNSIRFHGPIVAPELLWEIEINTWIDFFLNGKNLTPDKAQFQIKLHHFPQLRISRMLCCGMRTTLLRSFIDFYSSQKNRYDSNLTINKPNVWLFLDIHWKKLADLYKPFEQKVDLMAKIEEALSGDYNQLLSQEMNKSYNHHPPNQKEALHQGLHYTLCNNGYFISLQNTTTRYLLENWPIWGQQDCQTENEKAVDKNINKSFNKYILNTFNTCELKKSVNFSPCYSFSSLVVEKIYEYVKEDDKKTTGNSLMYKCIILGQLAVTDFFLKESLKADISVTTSKKSMFICEEFSKIIYTINSKIWNLMIKINSNCQELETTIQQLTDDSLKKYLEHECSELQKAISLAQTMEEYKKFKLEYKETKNDEEELIAFIHYLTNQKLVLKTFYGRELLTALELLKTKILNQLKAVEGNLLELIDSIYCYIAEINDFFCNVTLLNLINYLETKDCNFEIYLTNSWSDIGIVLYFDETNEKTVCDSIKDLYDQYLHFSQTHLLYPVPTIESGDKANDTKLDYLLFETTRNKSTLEQNNTVRTIGAYDYVVTSPTTNLAKLGDLVRSELKELLKNEVGKPCTISSVSLNHPIE